MTTEGPHLVRLTRILEERSIPVEPVLRVATAVGTANVFLGIGTVTDSVHLLVPSNAEALAAVAPSATLPAGAMVVVSARREQLSAAAMIVGAATARDAVDDVGPAAVRARWLPIVEAMKAGSIRNRLRYLTEERGSVTIMIPPRSGEGEAAFMGQLADVAKRVGAPASWSALYTEAGAGMDLGVTTECTTAGPRPRLTLRFGPTSWDRAIDLVKIAAPTAATFAAMQMGMLAGQLEIEGVRSVDAVLDRDEPDLVVWAKLRP